MNRRKFVTLPAALLMSAALAACTTTGSNSGGTSANKRQELNSGADATLNRLYSSVPGSREMGNKAKGILVFPNVLAAGFLFGAEYGQGVLKVGGAPSGYYSTTTGSFGLQAGAQSKAVIIMFMTQPELDKFRNSNGWTAGADASVALAKIGANGAVDTTTARQAVVAFVLTNAGLMANLSIEGTKISKLDL
ncbi:BPSL1445 family SYLF domain-containing lipoprotein [Achromobacter aloeverae]|uniref:BPSL1445 family SYLF domain-containing lipoprotein n=1 Tax=Achromobacter aloeverae TaxID=1750518 RepID=UPI0023D94CB8|nr:YSC84-related protein [Achromobacter aloeverae]